MTDSQGALVPNARVELQNTSTNQKLSTTTDADGRYRFTGVPVGSYRLATSSASSSPSTASQNLTVEVGRDSSIDLTMTTGPSTDTLVSAEPVPVSTATASIQRNLNTRMIQGLPQPNFISRNGEIYGAYNLSLLSEGVNPGVGDIRGPVVGGQRPVNNNYHIDGVDNNNKTAPGPLVYISPEASAEFGLFQNQQSPLFGHSGGGQFNTVVREGSNRVHGSVYDFFNNKNLNAVDRSYAQQGLRENPRYDQNRFGASLGMPIIPSKLFFFGNLEYIPLGITRPLGSVTYAPTAAGFAALTGTSGVSSSNLGILQSSFPNVGPATRTATINGISVPLGQVLTTTNSWQNQWIGTGSLDFTPYDKDQFHARYVHNEIEGYNMAGALPAFATSNGYRSLLASASWYHNFANAFTNELRLGYNRFNQLAPGAAGNLNGSGFPSLSIQEGNISLGPQLGFLQGATMNTYQLADSLSMRFGRHEVKFGFDGRRYLGHQGGLANPFGNYTYSSLSRFVSDLGPDVVSQRGFGDTSFLNNQWLLYGWLQDQFTVLPNLQVTLGVRYDYATVPEGISRQKFNTAAGLNFNEPSSPSHNFAPYVGLAYSPTFSRLTVFRAGFGVYYDDLYGNQYSNFTVPQFGANVYGNLASTTPGFLRGGGLANPYLNGSLTPAQSARLTSGYVNGDLRTPYSQQWNAAVEQKIWHNFTAQIKYLGSHGVHLPVYTQLNNPGLVTSTQNLPLFYTAPTQAQLNALPLTLNQLRSTQSANPLVQAGFTSPITAIQPDGSSTYHALAVSLNHRFTGGFQMLGNYTWSHLIDDSTGTLLDLQSATRIHNNSLYDRRHFATATAMWDVAGVFKNYHSWVRNIFADVTMSGTYTYASPQYLTPLSGSDAGLGGLALATGAVFNPNGTPGIGSGATPLRNTAGQVVGYQVTNPNAQFVQAAPGVYTGNAVRNAFSLGDTHNFDVSAAKRFSYADRFSFELRGDAYNVFNHPQYSVGSINSIGFRSPSVAPSYLIPGNAEFGNFSGNLPSSARILQLALKVTF